MEAPLDILDPPLGVVSPQHMNSVGDVALAAAASTFVSAIWPVASKAIFVPFYLPTPILIKQLFCENGSAVSGNIDIGLFNRYGDLIISTGSTAQAGVSAPQVVDIADTELGPGTYYKALSIDNIVGTTIRSSLAAAMLRIAGVQEMAAAFPLPNPATFTNPVAAYLPIFGFTTHAVM
jgi:hypothetical protein